MAMFKPSQSHSGGVSVNPYIGNIAQELEFLTGENRKKTTPFLDWIATGNPVKIAKDRWYNKVSMTTLNTV